MCKGSVTARRTVDAKEGETYGVGLTSAHRLGALHPLGMKADDCVACIKGKKTLTFMGVPPDLQRRYGISETSIVTFIEMADNTHDIVELETGEQITFAVFGDKGITAYVGVKQVVALPNGGHAPARIRELVDA